ncbi:histidine kinase [Microbacterium lushaniae]|uniref:Histidine kinase n=1 Tax=Microbacterium lushaniae TaxID=2614639 RepID=A0A5J6L2E0_9MICO|nr:histidine kinase [Microbacterium lushaniae]QEW02516.1 histidine kinase [Microbacterium lushaniae]
MTVRLIAAAILALEALGLAVLLVWQVMAMLAGDTGSLASAIALATLTLVGAVAVAAFAAATARDQSWGRSGGIVVQALILAVALGELTGENANPAAAALIAAPALVCAVLLILTVRAAGRQEGGRGQQP